MEVCVEANTGGTQFKACDQISRHKVMTDDRSFEDVAV